MKFNSIIIRTSILIMAGSLFSCSKYEEGPAIQLTPKSDRVANTWEVENATANGEDITEDFEKYEYFFSDDGDAELSAEYRLLGIDYFTETNGTWEFTNDKQNLSLDLENDDFDAEYQILKLTKDELWLREIGGDLELKFEEK